MRNCYCRFSFFKDTASTAIYTSCQFHILVAVGCAHGMTIVMVAEKTARQTTRPTLWPHMQRNQIDVSSLSLDHSQKMPRMYWWFHYAGHVYVYYWYTWLMDTSTRPAARGVVRHSDPQKILVRAKCSTQIRHRNCSNYEVRRVRILEIARNRKIEIFRILKISNPEIDRNFQDPENFEPVFRSKLSGSWK